MSIIISLLILKSSPLNIFKYSFININKHASSNETKIYSKIISLFFEYGVYLRSCINVKSFCQTCIAERCCYEMAAFKAGEFVEMTAQP